MLSQRECHEKEHETCPSPPVSSIGDGGTRPLAPAVRWQSVPRSNAVGLSRHGGKSRGENLAASECETWKSTQGLRFLELEYHSGAWTPGMRPCRSPQPIPVWKDGDALRMA